MSCCRSLTPNWDPDCYCTQRQEQTQDAAAHLGAFVLHVLKDVSILLVIGQFLQRDSLCQLDYARSVSWCSSQAGVGGIGCCICWARLQVGRQDFESKAAQCSIMCSYACTSNSSICPAEACSQQVWQAVSLGSKHASAIEWPYTAADCMIGGRVFSRA